MNKAAIKQNEPAAIWVSLDRIRPWKDNPRKNARAIAEVARAIKRFGFSAPIIARQEDGEIIAGHTRYEAAVQLGLKLVPVRFLDLDPADAHMLALADNRLGGLAEWDDEQLAEVLAQLRASETDLLDGTGFTDAELKKLLGDDVEGGEQTGSDPGENRYREQYGVIVVCADEPEQERVYEALKSQGYNCRVVVT